MDNLTDIRSDVKIIKTDLKAIGVTLAVNTESLIHHSARTAANEKRLSQVETAMLSFLGALLLALLGYVLKG